MTALFQPIFCSLKVATYSGWKSLVTLGTERSGLCPVQGRVHSVNVLNGCNGK
jgi:hypothetical protein